MRVLVRNGTRGGTVLEAIICGPDIVLRICVCVFVLFSGNRAWFVFVFVLVSCAGDRAIMCVFVLCAGDRAYACVL